MRLYVTLPEGNHQSCKKQNNAGSVFPCSAGYVSFSFAKENTEQRMNLNEYSQEMKKIKRSRISKEIVLKSEQTLNMLKRKIRY